MDSLHITTINTQGLLDKAKRNRLYLWIKHQRSNIILLQETHFTEKLSPFIRSEWHGTSLHSFGTSQSRGVSILIKNNFQHEIIDSFSDNEGRFIIVNIKIQDNVYTICNIYAPNNNHARNSFFKNVSNKLMEISLGNYIIGGDFNDTLNSKDRKTMAKNRSH